MKYIAFLITVFLIGPASCGSADHPNRPDLENVSRHTLSEKQDPNEIMLDNVLGKMKEATAKLTSCQADLSYLLIQDPDGLLNSKTLQKGKLYYLKDKNRANLRIRFDTLKQDDFEPEKLRQEYLFDGVWLKRIDFKLEQIDICQQTPENKPIDVFTLIKHYFPLVGFSDKEDLSNDFDITISSESKEQDDAICLLLEVKEKSPYKQDYKNIVFWVDNSTYLPKKVIAYSTQGDIYDIQFDKLQPNKKLKNAIFTIETPDHFRENVEHLDENNQSKGN